MLAIRLFFSALADLMFRHMPQFKRRKSFAFLVHPRDTSDVARKYPFLEKMSKKSTLFFLRHFWPVTLSKIRGLEDVSTGEEIVGYVITSPLSADLMKADPERARKSVIQAAKLAERKGAGIIGLGALTASLTRGGKDVVPFVKSGITTGRIFTSKIIVDTALVAINRIGLQKSSLQVAIVGAAGSIGTATAQILVRKGFRKIVIVDLERKKSRLRWLENKIKEIDSSVRLVMSHRMNTLKSADIIIAATNTPEVTIRSEHLKSGAIIIDDAQPSDVDPEILKNRNDVLVLQGGVAYAEHIDSHFNFGLQHKNDMFSCLGEVVILAGVGEFGSYSVGEIFDLDYGELEEMEKRANYVGVHVGKLQNINRVYLDEDFSHIKSVLNKKV